MRGLEIGQRSSVTRVFTNEDLAEYTALTGDATIGLAVDTGAGVSSLERAPLPGPLLAGLFSFLLGTRLPGPGTNYLKQRLHFSARAYVDEEITATVEITRLRPEKDLVNLRTVCTNRSGLVVCEGEALVLVKDVEMVPEFRQPGLRGGGGC